MESGHGMLDHLGSSLSFPTKEDARARAPTLPHRADLATVFSALLPQRETNHPLGCHRARIPDRVIFEKLVQVLVFGCAYRRIADEGVLGHHAARAPRGVDRGWGDRHLAGDSARSLRPIHRP